MKKWEPDDPRQIFVDGAEWGCSHAFKMRQDDYSEEEAERRYPEGRVIGLDLLRGEVKWMK